MLEGASRWPEWGRVWEKCGVSDRQYVFDNVDSSQS